MSAPTTAPSRLPDQAFRHEALFYSGTDAFVDATTDFIRQGLAAEEPILIVVSSAKIERLQARLQSDADQIQFADMAELGQNPARIIPAWHDFVNQRGAAERPVRGIGEPIWPGRDGAELVECQQHETLLNLAFADSPAWSLLCPYDTDTLEPAVVDEARHSHPFILTDGVHQASDAYHGVPAAAATLKQPLPPPPRRAAELPVRPLGALREFASRHATNAGLNAQRTADFVFSLNELVTNSLSHGEGDVTASVWQERHMLIAEVRDGGHLTHPLAGRERPTRAQDNGRGLWLVNQLCELVQLRSYPTGTVVRMHMRRPERAA